MRQGSLQDLLDSYVAWMEANGRRSAANVRISLATYVLKPWPRLAQVKAREITPADIRDILAAMIDKGVTTHSNRVRSYLHTAFQHGLTQEHNPRDFLGRTVRFGLTSNPVAAIPRQEDYERVGERTLSAEEVKLLWDHGIHEIGLVPASTFKLELATAGQRVGELLRLTWDDVDLDEALMTIPASVAKNRREHVVPIGEMAMQVLSDLAPLKRPGGPLCPGRSLTKPFHITSLNKCAERFCEEFKMEGFTTRDLRRTAKTLMGEAGLNKEIRDRLQNHSLHDVSSKHYDRYSYLREKRDAIARWDRYLHQIVSGQSASNVVELTRP